MTEEDAERFHRLMDAHAIHRSGLNVHLRAKITLLYYSNPDGNLGRIREILTAGERFVQLFPNRDGDARQRRALVEAYRTFLGFVNPRALEEDEDEDEALEEDEDEALEEDEDEALEEDEDDEDDEDPNFVPHENPFQTNITDNCDRNNKDAEGNPIDGVSYGQLEEGDTVKLSDGYCYDKDTVIQLYNRRPFASPFSRALFNEEDIKKAKTLKRAAPVGGSRKKKLNKKRKTIKKPIKKGRK